MSESVELPDEETLKIIQDFKDRCDEINNASNERIDEILREYGYDPRKLEEEGKEFLERLKEKSCQSNTKATDVSTNADTVTTPTRKK
jgi:hypothetical protein